MHEAALFGPIRRRLVAWTVLVLGVILLLLGSSSSGPVRRTTSLMSIPTGSNRCC